MVRSQDPFGVDMDLPMKIEGSSTVSDKLICMREVMSSNNRSGMVNAEGLLSCSDNLLQQDDGSIHISLISIHERKGIFRGNGFRVLSTQNNLATGDRFLEKEDRP